MDDISKSKSIDEVRNDKEYKDWVKSIKERDNECCVLCGANQHLEAHHVFSFKNFIPLRLDLHNGITLCHWCHKKYHAFYNLENTNPVTLLKFFKEFRFQWTYIENGNLSVCNFTFLGYYLNKSGTSNVASLCFFDSS